MCIFFLRIFQKTLPISTHAGYSHHFLKSINKINLSYCCHVVLQLVKSKKMHTKLEIVVETEKEKTQRKEFVFNDTKVKPHHECNI